MMCALDLFSAAAGGWSLGLHRAGFLTIAACEIVEWRRILYAENNPHVRLYEDVRDLTAARLVSDLGCLPDIIVGSPPCQDISSANTKGRGIDGERSGLYLEAVRLVGDCRPRWFAFENSPNLRTRGADRLLGELDALGYACEPCVVGASDVGANHVRKRSWLIGYDPQQLADTRIPIPAGWHPSGGGIGRAPGDEGVGPLRPVPQPAATDADGFGRDEGWRWRRGGIDISAADDPGDAAEDGRGSRRSGGCAEPVAGSCQSPCGDDADAGEAEWRAQVECPGDRDGQASERREGADRHAEPAAPRGGNPADTDQTRQPDGRLESGLRSQEIADDGRGDGRCDDGSGARQMGRSAGTGGDAQEPWADWNGGLARHLRMDDGLSAWVAGTRIAVGGPRGTAAASLIVEAFGDAVLPQIPEAIGRAILRTEAALDAVLGRDPHYIPGDEQ
ncbi:DNA cytosine methyltransferase [Rhizobiaceae bacterium BDR2-2]|uniref:DNA (cytosine-5-)-methyltransferase n=1 Tax=Ectorhizobium quercum TaxID=2965071 RepID=A0AAE3SY96_9HYPH|nr:DNA cytosine methyltransferase [Ectorhizobium quercum]MCX8999939.1 DNA cytosine methyltransferase [Ectorhizobium quercum]